MSNTRAHLKIRAKGLLIGNSGKAILLLIIPALFSLLLKAGGLFTASSARLGAWIPFFTTASWRYSAIALLFLLAALSLLVLPPLALGRDAWFWQRSAREYQPFTYAFAWYRRMGRAIALHLLRWLIRLGAALLFLLPAVICTLAALYLYWSGTTFFTLSVLIATAAALWGTGVVFTTLFLQRFFLAPYLLARSDEMKARDALRESARIMDACMMRGNTAKMKLSFLPWFLSCILILPILYVYPYYKQSCACYARHILNNERTPGLI